MLACASTIQYEELGYLSNIIFLLFEDLYLYFCVVKYFKFLGIVKRSQLNIKKQRLGKRLESVVLTSASRHREVTVVFYRGDKIV
jgi:hypothetical protein